MPACLFSIGTWWPALFYSDLLVCFGFDDMPVSLTELVWPLRLFVLSSCSRVGLPLGSTVPIVAEILVDLQIGQRCFQKLSCARERRLALMKCILLIAISQFSRDRPESIQGEVIQLAAII
jgi:hypothetical protein